jgi:hypothetical protein
MPLNHALARLWREPFFVVGLPLASSSSYFLLSAAATYTLQFVSTTLGVVFIFLSIVAMLGNAVACVRMALALTAHSRQLTQREPPPDA